MTLKEKFLELAFAKISSEELRDESVQLSEKFAIEFAEWIIDTHNKPIGKFTIKELLEIYKKEKGL
jgi:hypothetical protein